MRNNALSHSHFFRSPPRHDNRLVSRLFEVVWGSLLPRAFDSFIGCEPNRAFC